MTRKTAIAAAGAITLTLLAGSSALAANMGILSGNDSGGAGELSPIADTSGGLTSVPDDSDTTLPPQVETIIVDETVPAATGTLPPISAPTSTPDTLPDEFEDDDEHEDEHGEEYEHEDEHEEEHEEEEHEGRDDDD